MNRVYVYAICDEPLRLPRRMSGGRLAVRRVGHLRVLVERMDEAPAISTAALFAQHRIVMDLGRRVSAILPARFGSLLELPQLDHLLHTRRAVLEEALAHVRGREQMTVRIVGVRLAGKPERRAARGSGTDYLRRRREVHLGPAPELVSAVSRAVAALAVDQRVQGTAERATISHLVPRGTEAEYRARVNGIAPIPAHVAVEISGPWPPFAFVPVLDL